MSSIHGNTYGREREMTFEREGGWEMNVFMDAAWPQTSNRI